MSFIPQNTIDSVLQSTDIVDVIKKNGVSLKKSGRVLKGNCPFHSEKTPSFVVFEKTQSYKCFGCGEGGNAISFLMKKKGLSFYEAVKELGNEVNIKIHFKEPTEEELKIEKEKEKLYVFYKKVAEHFHKNLFLEKNQHALNYARNRFKSSNDETIKVWEMGYADDSWDDLYKAMINSGFSVEFLNQQDLFRQNKNGGYYDFFRDRLIFPIYDKVGRIIAFGGRDLSEKEEAAKYLNSSETLIYNKSHVLFGMHAAISAIREYDLCVLVEGYPDVVSLHQKGVNNVVASCGTSLTKEQISEISRYTKNFCLLYDADKPGRDATDRSAELIYSVNKSFNVFVLQMYEDGKLDKVDPDTFFKSSNHFATYYDSNILAYPVYVAQQKEVDCSSNATEKAEVVLGICRLFHHKNISEREILINQCSKFIGPKTLWGKAMKDIDHEKKIEAEKKIKAGRTDEQNKSLELYQFYTHNNCYYFEGKNGSGCFKGSNFTMEPLFHIESSFNAKRLYKLTNEFGVTRDVEFPQKDLIAISAFRCKVEGFGNFRFDAGEYGLNKIKAYLYEQTKTCTEITQLGWQKQGFWAWANGVFFDGQFQPISEEGICSFKEKYYYIPALSSFYKSDESLYQFERKMRFTEGKISLKDWLIKFIEVYEHNGIVGFAFYCAALFSDIITSYFSFFPILNMFGPKGTGKSVMAVSLSKLFGELDVGINLSNSTVPALADYVSRTSNSIIHIDEYKNFVDSVKIEFLKGLWDRMGRSRKNMDKDQKNETTAVNSAVILTGQEMATVDNALFSRVLFLSLTKTKFSDEERLRYNELKAIEKEGLTHITNQILSIRKDFVVNYLKCYKSAEEDLAKHIDKRGIEDRIYRNWLVIIAAFKCVSQFVELPLKYEKTISTFAYFIERQNREINSNNEVSNFWEIFTYLVREGIAEEGYDYSISNVTSLKTDQLDINEAKKIISVDLPKMLQEYSKHGRNSSQKLLPIKSLQFYLENSPEFLGKKVSRLKVKVMKLEEKNNSSTHPGDGSTMVRTRTIRTHVFDYNQLGLDIEVDYTSDTEISEIMKV